MLQAIRSQAASFVVKALFVLLIASFAVWGIGDIFRSRPQDTAVATVGAHEISAQELQTTLQPELERLSTRLGTEINAAKARRMGVLDAVLNQMIDRSLADQEVNRLRLTLADSVIREAIFGNRAFHTKDGRFNRTLFNEVLAQNHLTEAKYVALLRDGIPRSDLFRAVSTGGTAPQKVVDAIYRYRNQKRFASVVALPLDKAVGVGEPDAADLAKFYKAHQNLYRAPAYRGFTVAGLVPADLAKNIKVPEERLKKAYQDRRAEFTLPLRRQVEQILAPNEEKAKAAEKALAAGKGWKEVATTIVGQDASTVDIGLVKRGDLPPTLDRAVFSLPLDKPSKPLKSALGWHILRVVKIVKPSVESFAQVKSRLAHQIALNEAADRLEKIGNHVDDALAGGATLAEAAKKFGLRTATIKAVDNRGLAPDGKQIAPPLAPNQVLKVAFDTTKGQTSRIMHTDGGGIFAVHTETVTPPHIRPLADVKAKVVAGWRAEQRRLKVDAAAKALAAAVKPGTKLAAVAGKEGLKATATPPLLRTGQGSALPPALIAKLFQVKPGAAVTEQDSSGAFVAQLDKIEIPPPPKPAETADLARRITAGIQADLAQEFTHSLRRRFPVQIDHATLDSLF